MTQRIVRTETRPRDGDGDRDPHEVAISEAEQTVARLHEATASTGRCSALEDTPYPIEGTGRSA